MAVFRGDGVSTDWASLADSQPGISKGVSGEGVVLCIHIVRFQPFGHAIKVVRVTARQRGDLLVQLQVLLAHRAVGAIADHLLGDPDLGQGLDVFLCRGRGGVALVLFHELGDYPIELGLGIDIVSTHARRHTKQSGKVWKRVIACLVGKQRSKETEGQSRKFDQKREREQEKGKQK